VLLASESNIRAGKFDQLTRDVEALAGHVPVALSEKLAGVKAAMRGFPAALAGRGPAVERAELSGKEDRQLMVVCCGGSPIAFMMTEKLPRLFVSTRTWGVWRGHLAERGGEHHHSRASFSGRGRNPDRCRCNAAGA
jgi:hypothetical protein